MSSLLQPVSEFGENVTSFQAELAGFLEGECDSSPEASELLVIVRSLGLFLTNVKDLLGQAKDVIQIKEEKASDEGRHQGVERQLGATERNRTPRVGKSSSKSGSSSSRNRQGKHIKEEPKESRGGNEDLFPRIKVEQMLETHGVVEESGINSLELQDDDDSGPIVGGVKVEDGGSPKSGPCLERFKNENRKEHRKRKRQSEAGIEDAVELDEHERKHLSKKHKQVKKRRGRGTDVKVKVESESFSDHEGGINNGQELQLPSTARVGRSSAFQEEDDKLRTAVPGPLCSTPYDEEEAVEQADLRNDAVDNPKMEFQDALSEYPEVKQDSSGTFACTFCSYKASRTQLVHKHMRKHHQRELEDQSGFKLFWPHQCAICKRRYQRANDLQLHELINHRRCPCSQCGLVFESKRKRRLHVKIAHTVKVKPPSKIPLFTCGICDKHFATYNLQRSHMQSPHPKLPCSKCEESFTRSLGLERHIALYHSSYKDEEAPTSDEN